MSQLQVTGEAKIRTIQGPVVANSGVITALDGEASQYVRGDGTLADFPTSSGGGSSVSYYLNSSVSQGTIGGVAYRELSKDPITGAGTDISISANGYVANYITDVNDPDVVLVPGGNFNCEFYFSVNNNTGNPTTYAELYKYDGTTFTLLGSNVGVPESINQGTTIAPYYFAIPVATATLALTDRLAIRIYVNVSGRTVTLHTENGHLCQVVTTLSKGMVSLNNLTDQSQFLTTGTSGTNFTIASSGDTHTFNLPIASATNTGKLSSTDWSTFNNKLSTATAAATYVPYTGANANVDLGARNLSSFGINVNGDGTGGGALNLKNYNSISHAGVGYTSIFAQSSDRVVFNLNDALGTKYVAFLFGNLGWNSQRYYGLPNADGTLALTSNLSSYVPYTGATSNVDLGIFSLSAGSSLNINGNTTQGGALSFKQYVASSTGSSAGYTGISALGTTQLTISFNTGTTNYKNVTFDASSVTNNTVKILQIPDLSGTLALLEGGQTFTGAKTFSGGATFTTAINVNRQINISKTPSLVTYTGGYITNYGTTSGIIYADGDTSNLSTLNFNFGGNYTYTFPAATGTLALTSNLSSYVPYSGATGAVNLGAFDLTVNGLKVGRGGGGISTNTVLGESALNSNTTGSTNTAIGYGALQLNTTGLSNTAIGHAALNYNTTSSWNTAVGVSALGLSTGGQNTAIGYGSLGNSTTGVFNIAIGYLAATSITTGNFNTIIGNYAGTAAMSNNIVLADGAGNVRYQWDGTNNVFGNPLNGTSATFSNNIGVGFSPIITSGGAFVSLYIGASGQGGTLFGQSNATSIGLISNGYYDASNLLKYINSVEGIGRLYNYNGELIFSNAPIGTSGSTATLTERFRIASTGAATFSSSVTATDLRYSSSGYLTYGTGTIGTETFTIRNGAASPALTIAYGGAATFSSSVTANSFIKGIFNSTSIGGPNEHGFQFSNATTTTKSLVGGYDSVRGAYIQAVNFGTAYENLSLNPHGGNVGIGTSAPSDKLTIVGGNILVDQSSFGTAQLRVKGTGTTTGFDIQNSNNDGYLWNRDSGNIYFATGNTERMRITSGGDVLFGKTNTSVAVNGQFFQASNSWSQYSSIPVNANTYHVYDTTNSVYRFYVGGNGTINATNTTISAISDIRLKENITDLEIGLDAIMALRPRKFDWKKESGNTGKNVRGFIAQEFEEVFPDLIDESLNKSPEGDSYKQIRQDLIPVLVKAIQEQQAQIEELKKLIKNK